jgi:hypothetical protein
VATTIPLDGNAGGIITRASSVTTSGTDDEQTVDIKLQASIRTVLSAWKKQDIVMTGNNLVLCNTDKSGNVCLYNLKGEMVLRRNFAAGSSMAIPLATELSIGAYLLRLTQQDYVLRKNIVIK